MYQLDILYVWPNFHLHKVCHLLKKVENHSSGTRVLLYAKAQKDEDVQGVINYWLYCLFTFFLFLRYPNVIFLRRYWCYWFFITIEARSALKKVEKQTKLQRNLREPALLWLKYSWLFFYAKWLPVLVTSTSISDLMH